MLGFKIDFGFSEGLGGVRNARNRLRGVRVSSTGVARRNGGIQGPRLHVEQGDSCLRWWDKGAPNGDWSDVGKVTVAP